MSQNNFNTALLLTARQYRGLSQVALSQLVGVTQGYYSRIENGLLGETPSDETLQRIAHALDFPVSFFYQNDPVLGLPISVHPMYRKSSGVSDKALTQLNAELNIRSFQLRRLLHAVELDAEWVMPQLDVEDVGSPSAVAELVRRTWQLPNGPVQDLTTLLERAGCVVISCDFDLPVDGVTFKFPDLPRCIFLNKHAPPDRMRFSLAHELGHIIMHKIPTEHIEREANEFASAFLMPEKDIKRHLSGKLTIEKLVRLKQVWKVSIQALVYRAKQIGAISSNQYLYLQRLITKKGWRTREPSDTDFPYETPSIANDILELYVNEMGYSLQELQTLLHSSVAELRHFYGVTLFPKKKAGLRLVSG